MAAATPATEILAAADDEVSTAIAALFSGQAQDFQAMSARVAQSHEQFVQALKAGAGAYVAAESANAAPLEQVASMGPRTAPRPPFRMSDTADPQVAAKQSTGTHPAHAV